MVRVRVRERERGRERGLVCNSKLGCSFPSGFAACFLFSCCCFYSARFSFCLLCFSLGSLSLNAFVYLFG